MSYMQKINTITEDVFSTDIQINSTAVKIRLFLELNLVYNNISFLRLSFQSQSLIKFI